MTYERYLGASQRNSYLLLLLLKILYNLRGKNEITKKMFDPVRGILSGLFVIPKINGKYFKRKFDIRSMRKLILWLEATGEFDDEVKRFKNWLMFFEKQSELKFESAMRDAAKVYEWFKEKAKKELGDFSSCVNVFLNNGYKNYRRREDVIFCGKQEVEYHINMVASEIINWGFKEEFIKTKKRAILVPGCMRPGNDESCKASENGLDIVCTGCTKDCRFNKIRKLGKENNFEVFIVPHSTSFTRWLKRWENTKECCVFIKYCSRRLPDA
ncbi:MAG: DUF116 domain-containing protein [Ignavibacteria bacterium]|jgi:hypothetical protein